MVSVNDLLARLCSKCGTVRMAPMMLKIERQPFQKINGNLRLGGSILDIIFGPTVSSSPYSTKLETGIHQFVSKYDLTVHTL